jgi:hypothetical protein
MAELSAIINSTANNKRVPRIGVAHQRLFPQKKEKSSPTIATRCVVPLITPMIYSLGARRVLITAASAHSDAIRTNVAERCQYVG